ncbi:hypothetical protein SmaMPs15_000064 [Stenotrophomonas maltophilia phage vB_SmaM_Ps15]|uniref:Uncharacterized protein n=1 Tax=Stenotrophomonas maltophilia phage vB_SmaM_Ps15 TaxID=3071007 RepID=A0AAE9FRF4_9CAUD|nr:hypothetical protein PQC01_gp064 [Stenotrophomonas maltophilia phage vB_SmaM_Ps15]UMO77215.1 hypothetical protein SmaMPs15_000064 [Stenotrophomonas maltophilia phage vB_SmaM_Ps15]
MVMKYKLDTRKRLGRDGKVHVIERKELPDMVKDSELPILALLQIDSTYVDFDGDVWTRIE